MRDKRPVDELSIEELERILAIRKRQARMDRLRNYEGNGRRIATVGRTVPSRLPAPADLPDGELEQIAPDLAPVPTREPEPPEKKPEPPTLPPKDYYEGAPQFEDELDARRQGERPRSRSKIWALWWNRALMLVEVAAVIGLIVLIIGLFQSFQQVTETTARLQAEQEATARAAIVPPTATPVINIATVVLPTGHIFREDGSADINLDEIPAQYRDQFVTFSAQLPTNRPTPSPEQAARIRIPRINVDSVVVAGDNFEALKLGVGHHIGSANPGERGNMVLSAHNDIYGEIFRHLDRLQPGDEVIVTTLTGKDYVYIVQAQEQRGRTRGYSIVSPDAVWVLGASGDQRKLTLISCYPYRVSNQRIVVFATLAG